MKKRILSFAMALTTLCAMAQQIVDVSVYDDCSKNGYTKTIDSSGTDNGHEYVDLGLSVKWATCNVGATNAEDYGGHYAWSETATKSSYGWTTYIYGNYNTLTKYNYSSSHGTVDNKTTLELLDDAASVNWGGNWRIPTDAEWTELRENCTCVWTTQNGVNGCKVTATNGNSIFLPAAGDRLDMGLYHAGAIGFYWSSSLHESAPFDAWYLGFSSGGDVDRYYENRMYGFSVRPVHP